MNALYLIIIAVPKLLVQLYCGVGCAIASTLIFLGLKTTLISFDVFNWGRNKKFSETNITISKYLSYNIVQPVAYRGGGG